MSNTYAKTATIASGETASNVIDTKGMALAGVRFPAAFTGATVTIQYSLDGTANMNTVNNAAGAAITFTKALNGWCAVDPYTFALVKGGYIKVVSASSEAAERQIDLVFVSV
jgi:hypothetical protein